MKRGFFLLILCATQTAMAQQKPIAATPAPLKFKTVLAGRAGGDWSKELVKVLIDSPLVVKDEKGRSYPLVRFTFNYSFTSVYVDGATKQRKERKEFRSKTVDGANLSQEWRVSIKDNTRNGDVIFFNDVIIQLPDGKKRMVDDLTINVK